SALSGGAPSADPNHESARAVERREPAPDEGHSALPDRALVPDAALRQFDGGVEAVARDSDDRRDAAASRSAASRDNANDEGGSRRVARNGGHQRLQAFTGRKGLDLLASLYHRIRTTSLPPNCSRASVHSAKLKAARPPGAWPPHE